MNLKRILHSAATLATVAALLLTTTVAWADQVVNTIDSTVDTELETVTITAGGSVTVGFYIKTENNIPLGDLNGCNATGSNPATITLSVPAGVTASSTSLIFTSCGTTQSVTFSSGTAGSYTISVDSVTGGRPGSLWETAPAAFTLKVNPPSDTTPPVISYTIAGTKGNNDWYTSNVFVDWTVSDPESAVTIEEGCVDTTIDYDTTGVTLTCKASSAGGSASKSVTIKRDATPPSISASVSPARPASGWWNLASGAPTVSFTCSDETSGLAGDCPDAYTFGEGENQSYSQTIYDKAGNSATAGASDIDVDLTAPSISASVSPDRPDSGWWNIAFGAPTVSFECLDVTSGLAGDCPADHTFGEGENQSYSQTIYDNAGNSASAGVSDIDVDLTAPTISWSNGPVDGGVYYFGFVPAAPTCTASDALSGPAGCTVIGYSTAIGTHTLTATAYDVAGNMKEETRTYTVLAWSLFGFYQPVDMPTPTKLVYNTVKGGSTVPLKFEIFAGETELTDTASVKSLTYAPTSCAADAISDEIETVATGGTSLRYDWTAGQFIFNWQTPKTAGKCYRVTMTTLDGSTLQAFFKIK